MPLRVVLADDNYLAREGVSALLAEGEGIQIVDTATDLDSLMRSVAEHLPDVVLTDIRMPPTQTNEGIEAARRIRAEHPGVGVAVLSQHTEPAYAYALLSGGATGVAYLLKDRLWDVEELVRALREVAGGGSVIDPTVVDALVARQTRSAPSRLAALSPRERDVLREMAQGRTNAGIEQALHLSGSTVEKHVNAIFSKLGLSEEPVHRRVAAVLAYLQERG